MSERANFYLDSETRQRLAELARRSGRSMSGVIREIVKAAELPPARMVGPWWATSEAGAAGREVSHGGNSNP